MLGARFRNCSALLLSRPAAGCRRAAVPNASPSPTPTVQLHATAGQQQPSRSQLAGSCLYVLDLLPLIYRYLPAEQSSTAALAPAQPRAAEQQPQQEQQVGEGPAERFLTSLLSLVRRPVKPPTHMAIAVDVPGATYRHRLYPQYKAHRHEHPAALTDAICQVLALADALGIPVLAVPGVEADDVVGTLAAQAEQDGFGSVVIMSRDKDFYQLLSPTVSVLHGGAYGELYTLQQFTASEQLADPRLWRDIKALMGDPADNIPGLKGVGMKTAKQLVQAFGPVEQIAQRLAAMPEDEQKQVVKLNKKQRAMLLSEEGQLAAAFMKELVTINTHLKAPPCQQPWSVYELKVPADGGKRAREWAEKLQMNTLRFFLDQFLDRLADKA